MSVAEYAREHGLKRVGARPPLIQYLKMAWQRRDFAITMSVFANQAANSKNRLGKWWVILLPTIQGAVYGLIFGVIIGGDRPANFIPFLFTGVFLFSFIQSSISTGATSVTSNLGLVRSLNFPRMLLPFSSVLRQFLNLLPQIGLLLVVLIVFQQNITFNWLLMIPLLALMAIFAFGLALISARLTVHIEDINKLIPFANRVMFYTSGIFFSMERVLGNYPTLLKLMDFNPVYAFISTARGALVEGYSMSPSLWLVCASWAFGALLVGVWFFWKAEERYGRED